MTKTAHSPKRRAARKKHHFFLVILCVIVLLVAAFPFVIDRSQLPEKMKNHPVTAFFYDARERALSHLRPIALQKTARNPGQDQKGYSKKDRLKLDTLISTEIEEKK